ncbi:MAG: hypothetical protein DRR03_09285, partial [Gammaproteobacteria bacterium]
MDLWKHGQAILLGGRRYIMKKTPGSRFIEEVALSGTLVKIGEGIKANMHGTLLPKLFQSGIVELPDPFRVGIKIYVSQVSPLALDCADNSIPI